MAGLLATSYAILINGLVLLGMAFILSLAFPWLRTRSDWQRTIILSVAFGAMIIVTMMNAYPMGPGIIGDFRNVVIVVAAIVGGPVPALVTTAVAAVYRTYLGGESATALFGFAIVVTLSIGFARMKLAKTTRNLVMFGVVMATANAWVPVAVLLFSTIPPEQAVRISALFFSYTVFVDPLGIVVIFRLLEREQRRARDEAELRTLNAALALQAERQQGVFESSGVAIAWADLGTGRIIRANPQYVEFTGYSEAELTSKRFDDLAIPEEREIDSAAIKALEAGTLTFVTDEKRYVRRDGRVMWALRTLTVVKEGGAARSAFVTLQDITARKQAREDIAYLAAHDSLTGLFNRLVFHSELAEAIVHRQADKFVVALFLDLDDFKVINDTLGHPTGDAVLVEMASRLRATVAKGDIVARLGGNEFAVLCRAATTEAEVRALALRLYERVTQPYATDGDPVKADVSIGISLGPLNGEDADALVKTADIALHAAKAAGSGTPYLFFQSEMEERLVDREELKIDLTAALANNELEIEYQPSVDLRTGAVTSFEALLRWRHPLKGMMPPAEFIPLAEETGLIVPIGDWVLYQACREAMRWPAHISVAVNVSSAQFSGRLFAPRVAKALARSGLDPRRLELEITETLLLSGSDETQRSLRDLRQLGLKIALDDFGTGYSSLGYLQQFPFDRIKIDRSFVIELATRQASRTLVRAVIELGHSLNMRITAEGIETLEQLDLVSSKGCDEAQGFLFSQSVPPHEVPALIARIEASNKTPIGATG